MIKRNHNFVKSRKGKWWLFPLCTVHRFTEITTIAVLIFFSLASLLYGGAISKEELDLKKSALRNASGHADEPSRISLTPDEQAWLEESPEIAREEADYLFSNLEDRLNLTITDLITTYLNRIPGTQDEHTKNVSHLNRANPFLQTINYIDDNQRIRFVSPLEPNRNVIDLKIALLAPKMALDASLSSGKPVLSSPFVIVQGQMGYSLFIPHPRRKGAFEVVFRAEAVFGPGSPFRKHKGIALRISDGSHVVYTSPDFREKKGLVLRTTVEMMGRSFQLEMIPGKFAGEKELLVGSELDYPPFAIINKRGEADGFSVDLFKAVAHVMGLKVRFRVGPGEEVRTALERGEIDALPLVSYSEEREKVFDFTTPHTTSDAVAFIRKGEQGIKQKKDLHGKRIIVMRADATHDYLLEQGITENLLTVKSIGDALRLLASGGGDLAFLPRLTGLLEVKRMGLNSIIAKGPRFNVYGRGYGFAVQEGNTELLAKLNLGLSIVKASGQYDEIYDKWFGLVDPRGVSMKTILRYTAIVSTVFLLVLTAALLWSWSLRREVKQRRLAEAELNRQRIFVEAILENIQDGIVACDDQGLLVLFNRATRIFHGIDVENLPPDEWASRYDLFLADGVSPMSTEEIPLVRAFRGERVQNQEMVIAPREGIKRTLVASGQAMMDEKGRKLGAVISMHDITDRRKAEIALKHAKDAAEAANRAKSVFLANMSHELRTPLNAILGFSEMLGYEIGLKASQKEKLHIIRRSAEHLLDMINDVLDLSKIEAGKVEMEISAFDLPRMLLEIGQMFEIRAQRAGLRFIRDIDPALVRYIRTDIGKLRQVLINLLGNAVNFTAKGSFSLIARSLPVSGDPGMCTLQIEVVDSGPGIPEEQIERIFEPFVQIDRSRISPKGTGLGLAITKAFIRLMKGKITVVSRPGEGARFCVELPVSLAEVVDVRALEVDKAAVTGLEPGQPEWRILIAEDNIENRLLLSALLEQAGFKTRSATNGEEAIALFEQWHPHFIWMDMRMPVMDGFEATLRIRALPGGDRVKIVAVTASAFKEERKNILEAGCDEVVHKPFKSHEIFDVMAQQLDVHYIYEEKREAGPEEAGIPLTSKILADLPAEVRAALKEASHKLDISATNKLIDQIRITYPEIARGLQLLAKELRFDRILELLDGKRKSNA